MQVTRSGECKNSPKNAFVENLTIDMFALKNLGGRVAETAILPSIPNGISSIQIIHAISHGKVGAANGNVTIDGEDIPFSVFIEFATAKGAIARKIDLYLTSPL